MDPVGNYRKEDFSRAYTSLKLFSVGPLSGQGADIGCRSYGARFKLDCDLAPLFPYINALARHVRFYETPVYIKFMYADRLCAFYPDCGAFAPASDLGDAMDFLPRLLDYLLEIAGQQATITPNHKHYTTASAVDIYRLLPATNCGDCGYTTCMAFAAASSRRHTSLAKCPHLTRPVAETATFPVYDDQGQVVRTISMDIDTHALREEIDRKESRIQELQMQLAQFEKRQAADFDLANARLPTPLTRREIQVLQRIVGGATNREISTELAISVHTVKSHVIGVFNKLGMNDRAQAAAWGALNGISEGG